MKKAVDVDRESCNQSDMELMTAAREECADLAGGSDFFNVHSMWFFQGHCVKSYVFYRTNGACAQ